MALRKSSLPKRRILTKITKSRLIIQAASEDTVAEPGNRKPNYIVVSVTDESGQPVTSLTKANFKVDPLIVGPGGSLVNITSVRRATRISSFYFIDVVPIRNLTWKKGVHIFGIVVEKGHQRGQALASVLLD